ncbi:MAG TPA: hypothetical protein VJI98_06610 [Candidatus Nanoarchaeia archaeon]|nr:hypothetical protein [Candidatus Nanoarchaeia archaeon]
MTTENPYWGKWPGRDDESKATRPVGYFTNRPGNMMADSNNPQVRALYKAFLEFSREVLKQRSRHVSVTSLERMIVKKRIPKNVIDQLLAVDNVILKEYLPKELYDALRTYKP